MWAMVTGAGSGIGSATALSFASRGINTLLVGRRKDRLDRVVDRIQAGNDRAKALAIPADVTRIEDRALLRDQVGEQGGRLDYLVHCAGIGEPATDLMSQPVDEVSQALEVNVTAPLALTQAVWPTLNEAEQGRVMWLGAGMDEHVQQGTGCYGISKMAVRRLFRQLAEEWTGGEHGPKVALFQPGVVATEGLEAHLEKARALGLPHTDYLEDKLAGEGALTAEQVGSVIAHVMISTSSLDYHGSVFHGPEWVDALFFQAS